MPDGRCGRTELVTCAPSDPTPEGRARIMPSPWRRILCVVDLNKDSADGLSTARSALRYATMLAVIHQARIAALHVISDPSSQSARMSVGDEPCRSGFGEPFRGLIDVHVAIGSPNEDVMRVAKDIDADLIVIGRSGHGDGESMPQLSETPRRAPWPRVDRSSIGAASGRMTRRPYVCWT
jgi:hypothetical protein